MRRSTLVIGDAVALAVVTLVGFGSHGEFSAAFLPRMAASFLPLCAGWYVLAPWFGLFDVPASGAAARLWLPAFVMLFAGPFAAVLRSVALGAPVAPTFAVVLSVTGAVALTVWRGLALLLGRRAAG